MEDAGSVTELDIINTMIATTGTAPLTGNSTRHPLYLKAKNTLSRVSREVQNMRLWYNTSKVTLSPNSEGFIIVPQNITRVDPLDNNSTLVRRGRRLFDTSEQTYVFDSPVVCEIVQMLPINELPTSVATYIQYYARHEYYKDEDGADPRKMQDYRDDRARAYTQMHAEHLASIDVNYFKSANNAGLYLRRGTGGRRRLPV